MKCVNTSSVEFQTLVKQSGLTKEFVELMCFTYSNEYNRFPRLDELPGVNSEPYLKEQLNIRKKGFTKLINIFTLTNTDNIQSAQQKLNKVFTDLEIEIKQFDSEDAIIKIKHKPQIKPANRKVTHSKYLNSASIFSDIIYKLQDLYGIQIIEVNEDTIKEFNLEEIPGAVTSNAFVYNGIIFINPEFADADAPIHEMMHLLMSHLKYQNQNLYYSIVQSMVNTPVFNYYRQEYKNRTQLDVAEEAFVSEFAKLVAFGKSSLSNLPAEIIDEIFENAKTALDTILMGEVSVKGYSNDICFQSSLRHLSWVVDSKLDEESPSNLNRDANILANKKQELFENNELTEECYG